MLLNCRADLTDSRLFGWEEDGVMEGIDDAFDWFLKFFFTPNPIEAIAIDFEEEEAEKGKA